MLQLGQEWQAHRRCLQNPIKHQQADGKTQRPRRGIKE